MGCGTEPRSMAMMQRSYSDYEYFASGRKNSFYAHFKIALKHRHCLMSTMTFDLFYGVSDTLTIEIPIDLNGRDVPIEFYICRRRDWKKKSSENEHLTDYVQVSNAKNYRLDEK